MHRPSIGKRTTSSSSVSMHNYFLRSATTTCSLPGQTTTIESAVSSPACSDKSDSSSGGRTLKKKASFWNMFSRGSRKISACANMTAGAPLSVSNMSTMNIDIPSANRTPTTLFGMMSMSEQSLDTIDSSSQINHPSARALRSQKSMHTIHSTHSAPTLRNAKSQFSLRLPSGVPHFDTDSIFSDESEGEVSVSWITSKGLRKVGLDLDDDCDMVDMRR